MARACCKTFGSFTPTGPLADSIGEYECGFEVDLLARQYQAELESVFYS